MNPPIIPPPYFPQPPAGSHTAPDFVAAVQQIGAGGVPSHLMGPPAHEYVPAVPMVPAPFIPPPAPAFDHAAALQQLDTLDTFAAAVEKARALGGPTAVLQALIQRPIKVGPFTLQKCSLFTFLFLNNIKSPYIVGGTVKDLDLAKALLAFTDPEAAAIYLDFHGEDVLVDHAQLTRDAYRLAGLLDRSGITAATDWIAAQIGGLGRMMPSREEAENFPMPEGMTPPPETAVSLVPPAGWSSSSTS